jgi:MOSC domain-containing protein YiiM
MQEGLVAQIFVGPEAGAAMKPVEEVAAVTGKGLEGDRYFEAEDEGHDPSLEVTLFSAEGLEAGRESSGLDISPEDMRRNLMTEGVSLSSLIGRRFAVGEVQLEGLEENPPCSHLQQLAGKPLLKPMIDNGGIRARILVSGTIRVGDEIWSSEPPPSV